MSTSAPFSTRCTWGEVCPGGGRPPQGPGVEKAPGLSLCPAPERQEQLRFPVSPAPKAAPQGPIGPSRPEKPHSFSGTAGEAPGRREDFSSFVERVLDRAPQPESQPAGAQKDTRSRVFPSLRKATRLCRRRHRPFPGRRRRPSREQYPPAAPAQEFQAGW